MRETERQTERKEGAQQGGSNQAPSNTNN
jgi:hypothetical protein